MVIDDETITDNSSEIDIGVLNSVIWDDDPCEEELCVETVNGKPVEDLRTLGCTKPREDNLTCLMATRGRERSHSAGVHSAGIQSGSGAEMTDGEASDDSEDEIQRRRSRRARFVPEPQEEPEDRTGPGNREEPRFTFGQYNGESFSTISEEKPDYYF